MAGNINIIGDTGCSPVKREEESTISGISRCFENDDAKKLLTFFNTELHGHMHIDVNIQKDVPHVELRTDKQYEKKLEEVFSGLQSKIKSLVCRVIDCKHNKEEIVKKFSKNSHILPVPSDRYDIVRLWSDDQAILDKALIAFENKTGESELKQSSRRGRFKGSEDLGASGKYEEIDDSLSRSKRNNIYTEGWKPDIKLNFSTPEGLKVKVYKGSIVKLKVDAIVNAANEHLANGAGVAGAISDAAGFRFDRECKDIIRNKGQIPVTENDVTGAGDLPCRAVIHAVGPRWHEFHRKEDCLVSLKDTVFNVLKTAYKEQFSRVVMPPISSGIFGVPKAMCAAMYILGIMEFSKSHKDLTTSVEELHIIDIKDDMLYKIEDSYRKWRDDPASIQPAAVLGKTSSSNRSPSNSGSYGNWEERQINRSLSSSQRGHTGARPKEVAQQRQCCTFRSMGDRTEYLFREKLKVLVYKGDITKTKVDAIVSTENRKFDGSGGLSKAIRAAAGKKYHSELERMFSNVTKYHSRVLRSSPGNLKQCKCVFHVIIEQLSANTLPKDFELRFIENGIKNVLEDSNNRPVMVQKKTLWKNDKYETKLKTIAMPLLGAGAITTELYIEMCCASVFDSLLRFATSFRSVNKPLNLEEVHLVDNRDFIIECMNKTFKSLCTSIKGRPPPISAPRTQNNELLNKRHRKSRLNKSDAIKVWKVRETGDYDMGANDKYMEKVQHEVKPATTKERKGNLMIINEDHSSDTGQFSDDFDPLKDAVGAAGSADTEVDDCIICMDKLEDAVKLKKCGHMFCKDCVVACFRQKPVCPVCNTVYGCLQGDQPLEGNAFIYKDKESLPGYNDCGTIIIDYEFPDGIQGEEHPQPGEQYKGLSRQCYLPDDRKGNNVLQMLKQAFEQRLIFTIGQSRTSGEDNVLTWNDIHHKTRRDGGPEKFGYPDPEYLDRVEEELNAKGIE